jgi:hypothetical protein
MRPNEQYRRDEIAKLRKRLSSLERGEIIGFWSGASGPMRDVTDDDVADWHKTIKFHTAWLERHGRIEPTATARS